MYEEMMAMYGRSEYATKAIDEYRLAIHPVLAGHGPTLFSGLSPSSRIRLLDVRRFRSGVMALHYRKK